MIRTMPHKQRVTPDRRVAALLRAPEIPVGECPYPVPDLRRPHSMHMVLPWYMDRKPLTEELHRRDYAAEA